METIEQYSPRIKALFEKHSNGGLLTIHECEELGTVSELVYTMDGVRVHSDVTEIGFCPSYIFQSCFLRLIHNWDGSKPALGPEGLASPETTKKYVDWLKAFEEEWMELIQRSDHSDQLLNLVSSELRNQLRTFDKEIGYPAYGTFRKAFLRKGLSLYAAYIYYEIAKFHGKSRYDHSLILLPSAIVCLDDYSYVHCLMRHFASTIHVHLPRKTYNSTLDFRPDEFLLDVETSIRQVCIEHGDSWVVNKRLVIELGSVTYSAFFKSVTVRYPGVGPLEVLRLSSIYPTT